MNFRKGGAEHIQLLKLDKETGQALGGVKVVVTDSKGNKVMKFVTKDDAYDITGNRIYITVRKKEKKIHSL